MLLQQIWMAGLDWDEELTEPLTHAARAWFSEIPELMQLQIPQCLLVRGKQVYNISLHTFVDASEEAYRAVAYVRYSFEDGTISTNVLAAKTRVTPTTATSIPRLELMGAVIGVRLSTRIGGYWTFRLVRQSSGLTVRKFFGGYMGTVETSNHLLQTG